MGSGKKITLLIGIHNHQPVGNFDNVIQDAYDRGYRPFLEILAEHPAIKVSIHVSGPLLRWLEQSAPEYLDRLKELVARGQVEILSGGFYEPILTVIPRADAISQIEKMNNYFRNSFGFSPRGLWLAERIWEPQMASVLADAGIEYTMIDESHFSYVGLTDKDMFGYYVTEDNGSLMRVFPISKMLRYSIPFRTVDETIQYLEQEAVEWDGKAVTFGDDGEKFGIWPHTYEWVYEEGYLKKLFEQFEQNSDWISLMHFGEYMDRYGPVDRLYLPTASYEEMMEWSLPTQAQKQYHEFVKNLKSEGRFAESKSFVRGGFWRNFMAKYQESNLMHKKMLYVSQRVRNERPPCAEALDSLWQGQCNCPYWHGLFGGLYLPHLRHANYSRLIAAENIADQISNENGRFPCLKEMDFDVDGRNEVLMTTRKLNCYIMPHYGGSVFEIDYRPKCFNITNNLMRREEAYHARVHEADDAAASDGVKSAHDIVASKEKDLEQYLVYDWHQRFCFLDHFFGEGASLSGFRGSNYPEVGDFVNQPYQFIHRIKEKEKLDVLLRREGHLYLPEGIKDVAVEKRYILSDENLIKVNYSIQNLMQEMVGIWYGCELNFSLLAGNAPDRYYLIDGERPQQANLASAGETRASSICLVDEYSRFKIFVECNQKLDVWRMPIETVSQSEGGFERNYQSSCIVFNTKEQLEPQEDINLNFSLNIDDME